VFGSGQQQKWAQPEYSTLVNPKDEYEAIYGSNSVTITKDKKDLNEFVSNNNKKNEKRTFDNQG
jgi:hypothetical protein